MRNVKDAIVLREFQDFQLGPKMVYQVIYKCVELTLPT